MKSDYEYNITDTWVDDINVSIDSYLPNKENQGSSKILPEGITKNSAYSNVRDMARKEGKATSQR